MSQYRKDLGKKGEDLAEAYLTENMFRIVARNVRISRGEIDVIAWDGDTLVFIEVKTRTSDRYGIPAESVDRHKQKKLRELALLYLQNNGNRVKQFRFDVIAILIQEGQGQITHIKHAF